MLMVEKLKPKIEKIKQEVRPETESEVENLDFHTLAFIKGGHIDIPNMANFDPTQSLAEIKEFTKHLSKENSSSARAALVREFRKNLKIFRESTAEAQLAMEGLLRALPDADTKKLGEELGAIIEDNSLQSLRDVFMGSLEQFVKVREILKDIILKFKEEYAENWQEKFFEEVFKKLPEGRIEIELMPITILMKIYNPQDFIAAFSFLPGQTIDQESLGSHCGTLLNGNLPIADLKGRLIIENLGSGVEADVLEMTDVHEEEHAIHKNLFPTSTLVRWEKDVHNLSLKGEVGKEEFEESLRNFVGFYVMTWKQTAKTEVLAYWKANQLSSEIIHFVLVGKDSHYNFLKDYGHELDFTNNVSGHLKEGGVVVKDSNGKTLNEEQIKATALRIINEAWDLYNKKLTRALNGLYELEEKYGNDTEARLLILRLISQEPIDKWHRLIKTLS